MSLKLDFFIFGQNIFDQNVSNNIHVEWKAIRSWIGWLASFLLGPAIIGPHRVSNTAAEYLTENNSTLQDHSAFIINVKLSSWLFLAEG